MLLHSIYVPLNPVPRCNAYDAYTTLYEHWIAGQTESTIFPTNFPSHLDDRYCGLQFTSTPSGSEWNSFVANPPLLGRTQLP